MAIVGVSGISIALISLFTTCFANPEAYPLKWSPNVYGPDGPWHAVRVALGTPPQELDLYPATWYSTWPLTSSVCNDYAEDSCDARKGGFYDPNSSSSFQMLSNKYIGAQSTDFARTAFNNFGSTLSTNGSLVAGNETLHFVPGSTTLSVPESGLEYVKHANFRAAGGATYPITLGYLTLGAGLLDSLWKTGPNTYQVAYSWLYTHKIIPSPSWTMHIGSPSLGIKPSMYLGGYDENRVMGDALPQILVGTETSFNNLAVNITNIAIGTVKGPSPFVHGDQPNLMSTGGASTDQINIEPAVPYLFLPAETCTNLAYNLPVTYHGDLGLYLWDTQDPRFKRIMRSRSYLSFSLRAAFTSGGNTVEIKIPFQLLNLTLSEPITSPPVQYFPCSPVSSKGVVSLGRAFLQAAFIGVNWYLPAPKSWWFVAQAPGPGLNPPVVRGIQPLDHGLFTSSLDWESSWSGYWDSLKQPRMSKESTGLSTGAEAGIGVGVALGILLIIGIIMFVWWRRRRRSSQKSLRPSSPGYSSTTGTYMTENNILSPSHHSHEAYSHQSHQSQSHQSYFQSPVRTPSGYTPVATKQNAELEQPSVVHELPGYNTERYELSP